jgi:hypothetical protein
MLSTSRYILAGSPHNCSFCREPLTVEAHRRGNGYFCNELCAYAAPQESSAKSVALKAAHPYLTIAA